MTVIFIDGNFVFLQTNYLNTTYGGRQGEESGPKDGWLDDVPVILQEIRRKNENYVGQGFLWS